MGRNHLMEEQQSQQVQKMLIIAAEASSTLYAERLISEFQKNNHNISFFGVGSKSMEELGFKRLGSSEEMAVVGFQEILAHYSEIKKVFNKVIEAVKVEKPAVILLLDYPGFNLKLAKELSSLNIPIVYYISPQIWAWKTSRITIVQKYIQKMLVLFPFEKDFYKKYSVDVEFVGHPLIDELKEDQLRPEFKEKQRALEGFTESDKVLGLMPGSRKSEIKFNFQTQIDAALILKAKHSDLKICVLVAESLNIDDLKLQISKEQLTELSWVQKKPVEMIALTDVILCASGTATIFVGLMEKPLVIMYKMNAFTAYLAKKLVKNTPFFGMVNLILNKEVGKEFFQSEAHPKALSDELETLIYDDAKYDEKVLELKKLKVKLGNSGATKNVYNQLMGYFS
jgi:lipid-A-disaccharide synthase